MGLKLSRKIRSLKDVFLFSIKKKSLFLHNITIAPFVLLKFLYKKSKKKTFKKYSNNLDNINNYEFKKTSQNNEDGIIEHIFDKIHLKKINFIEIGFDYYENNSLNFLSKTNKGLFIDGSSEKVFKLKCILNLIYPFKKIDVVSECIDKENLNSVIEKHFEKKEQEVDFLSIDVDGNDYYLFETLKIKPKIVCIEYNFWFGPNAKCSIPYNKNFSWDGSIYSGASLSSLCSLAKKKGYHLIALESNCVNAFFVRSDLKNNFEIIDNLQSFRTPIKYSNDEILSGKNYLLDKKLTNFN